MECDIRTDAAEVMSDDARYIPLTLPTGATINERRGFVRLCTLLAGAQFDPNLPLDHAFWIKAAELGDLYNKPHLGAAAHTLIDLVDQGCTVQVDKLGPLLSPPDSHHDRETEKARIRRQEHLRRDAQLRQPSVRRFVASMERSHQHGGRLVSIFNVMRDGRELADALETANGASGVIQPYVQIVDSSATCELTGFNLHDIWRYFRHTWANAYSTVPGRSLPILIRDAATEFHAVIGLAAISSPVVQIAGRDTWMGWDTKQFVTDVENAPTDKIARWLAMRIKTQSAEIYVDDLLRDGVLQPNDLKAPTQDVVARLRADAERHRAKHHRGGPIREVRSMATNAWVERAETPLSVSYTHLTLPTNREV